MKRESEIPADWHRQFSKADPVFMNTVTVADFQQETGRKHAHKECSVRNSGILLILQRD